ncbi:MAG: helix-turn-helix transcriptional regulator [Dysgonomonas sp.]|uniref:S24 family peptidase n=1 Tax=Dysgonomonas sp. TaxID=1891233 RepID=UPI003A8A2752
MSQDTGISESILNNIDKNKNKASIDVVEKILNNYSVVNAEWLVTGQGSMLKEDKPYDILESIPVASEPQISLYKLKTDYYGTERQVIPLYEIEASAGLALLFSNQSQQIPLDHIILPNAPKCDGAMYIRGDSMYPLLKAGDIACYKTIHNIDNVIMGEKYILDISNGDDDYLTIKYVQKSEKGNKYFKLVSENKYHADRDIHISTIRALAMVKATIRFETLA